MWKITWSPVDQTPTSDNIKEPHWSRSSIDHKHLWITLCFPLGSPEQSKAAADLSLLGNPFQKATKQMHPKAGTRPQQSNSWLAPLVVHTKGSCNKYTSLLRKIHPVGSTHSQKLLLFWCSQFPKLVSLRVNHIHWCTTTIKAWR